LATGEREPVLKDVRDNLETILDLADNIRFSLNTVHDMIDKDLYADLKVHPLAKKLPEAPPNLRFDMDKISKDAIKVLEEILKELSLLKSKLHVPEPEKVAKHG